MADIFCRIIAGEIPSAKIYEDEDVLAILDISQVTDGHALVMPKAHAESFLDCPEETMHKVMNVAKAIANAQIKLGAQGVNIVANCKESAGQAVPHFHVHVVPRYGKDDGFKIVHEERDVSGIDLQSLAKTISEAM